MKAKDSFSENIWCSQTAWPLYIQFCDVYVMLCMPTSEWIFGGEGQLLLLVGGLEGTQVLSEKVRSGVGRLRYSGGLLV